MNAAKVGMFTLAVLLVLAGIITWKSNLLLIRQGYELKGSFSNIEGLSVGSEVRYRGFNIGKIMRIDPGPSDIKVYALIKKDIRFPVDSQLRVGFDGIVGMKYLEIKPGTSKELYAEGNMLYGISTAGIVDFVDIGAQNLAEMKQILVTLKEIVQDPTLQMAFKNAVLTGEKVTIDVEKLVEELRSTNAGIRKITTDPEFQASVKGTVSETNKTLSSANRFFESFSKLNVQPSAQVLYGNAANDIRANLDVLQAPGDYLRIGIGEGPTQNIGLLDVEIARQILPNYGMRLGMINMALGGGIDYFPSSKVVLSGDIYDFSNAKPRSPKVRATFSYGFQEFVDLYLQADDIFNNAATNYTGRNYMFGIKVNGFSQ